MANLISPASAAVIGNVKVSGNVQDRATSGTSAPSNQAVFKYLVAPEKPQPPNDRKALMSAPAC
ncbi:hypothetical protein [Xanthomonas vasicola]